MKVTIKQVKAGENEIIIKYQTMTTEIEQIIGFVKKEKSSLIGWLDKKQVVIKPNNIFYIESVDGKSFACTYEE